METVEKKKRRRGSLKNIEKQSTRHLSHWASSGLWCPHCRRAFKYREMWAGLGREGLTVWEVASLLGMTWQTVAAAVTRHGMSLSIKGTPERNSMEELALRAGFDSARKMMYSLVVTKGMTNKRIGELLNLHPVKVAKAVEQLLGGDSN
jgi:hypothetical protein